MKHNILQDPFESELRLAREQLQAGRIPDAERIYRDILNRTPAHPAACFGLGRVFHDTGNDQAAIEYLQTAVKAWPQHLEARFFLAVSLYRLQRLEESAGHFEKSIRHHPNVAATHNYLGIVKARLDAGRQAEQHFLSALELEPSLAEAHKNLGTHYAEQGRIDEARDHLKKAVACRPHYAQAFWQLASITRFTDYDDDIRSMESAFDSPDIDDAERMGLAYALGKAFDDLRQYPRAFEYWQQGNDLRRRLTNYSVGPALVEMRAMKRVFSAAACARADRTRITTPALIFIVGMPRSGTSLTEQILASHSAVYGAGELDALDTAIRSAVQKFPADLKKLGTADWNAIRERYLGTISSRAGDATCVTDKLPGNFLHAGAIGVLFPDAKIIHCCRDPMDTGLSCFKNHFTANQLTFTCNLADLGRYYRQYCDLMAHWKRIPDIHLYDLHYESLVTDPENEVRKLLAFCELPFEENCLAFHNNRRPVKTASALQVRRPIYRDSLQGWKRYERELQPLKAALQRRPGPLAAIVRDMASRFQGSSQ